MSRGYSVDPSELGLSLDERGLLPLEQARARVREATAFVKGEHRPVLGQTRVPLDSDLLWVALLSLEDAAEFTREATRLTWQFPLRGWDNHDAFERFGPGVLPWLEHLLGQPPLAPHFRQSLEGMLIRCGEPAARAVIRTRREGDADPDGLGLTLEWLRAHRAAAWKALAALADGGDEVARDAFAALVRRNPAAAKKALGKRAALPAAELEADVILKALDAAAAAAIGERLPWPTLNPTAGHFEYHAMRLIAVRAEQGDDWGVLLEVAQGDDLDPDARWPGCVQRYTYGSRVTAGGRYLDDARPLKVDRSVAKVSEALARELDLRPGLSMTGEVAVWGDVLAIRATLARNRALVFPDPVKAAAALKVKKPQLIAVSDAFEHVSGTGVGADRLPSTSVAWRSLAEAIAHRDPKRFMPGAPNTDWRLHAKRRQAPEGWPS